MCHRVVRFSIAQDRSRSVFFAPINGETWRRKVREEPDDTLTTVYLLSDNFSKNSQLVEQAIELVGAVNKALPWAQYDHNIKYYLELFSKEIAHQRQLVKIITAILD